MTRRLQSDLFLARMTDEGPLVASGVLADALNGLLEKGCLGSPSTPISPLSARSRRGSGLDDIRASLSPAVARP